MSGRRALGHDDSLRVDGKHASDLAKGKSARGIVGKAKRAAFAGRIVVWNSPDVSDGLFSLFIIGIAALARLWWLLDYGGIGFPPRLQAVRWSFPPVRLLMRREIDESASSIKSNRRVGFTLVELLVVIGIIAVLIAILLPVLGRARAQANRAACLSNIRQLGIGVLMYCNDNEGWFPTCAAAANNLSDIQYPDDWVHWQANRSLMDSAIARYVGRGEELKSVLRCPADTFDGRKTRPGSTPGQGPYLYSYGMNSGIAQNLKGSAPRGYRTRISRWRSPSRKIMLTESWVTYEAAWYYGAPLTRRHGVGKFHKDIPGTPEMRFGTKMGVNVSAVFLDGHADSIDQDFSYNPIHDNPEAR